MGKPVGGELRCCMTLPKSIYSGLRAVKLAPWRYGAKAEPKCPPRMPKKSDD